MDQKPHPPIVARLTLIESRSRASLTGNECSREVREIEDHL